MWILILFLIGGGAGITAEFNGAILCDNAGQKACEMVKPYICTYVCVRK